MSTVSAAAIRYLNTEDGPHAGQVWRHVDGTEYEIVCRSFDEFTVDPLVTYRSDDGLYWTRLLSDFTAKVIDDRNRTVPRFTRAGA